MKNVIEEVITNFENQMNGKLPDDQRAVLYGCIEAGFEDYADGLDCECVEGETEAPVE